MGHAKASKTLADKLLPSRDVPLRFDARELAGSLGDLGTFLPLAFAMAVVCGMDIALIFIFAGLMNIVTGWYFRQPIPVQPMKAIAAVAIAEGLTGGAIASAGLFMGAIVLTLAIFGGVDWIAKAIPKPVVRGIQAGVGAKLVVKGFTWLWDLPLIDFDSQLVAIIVGVIVTIMLMRFRRQPTLLYVFLAGFVLLAINHSEVYRQFTPQWPTIQRVAITNNDWWIGLTRGAIPQLPLTLLNSVIAVCALSSDYFPGRGVAPKRMAASVGLMNLLTVPFGAMPMCHGAGGLAAQYRFGARTGGSVIMLGVFKIIAGLLLGSMLLALLQQYPVSILAIMVIAAGITLASAARDALIGRPVVIVFAMVATILIYNTLASFIVGCAIAIVFACIDRIKNHRASV